MISFIRVQIIQLGLTFANENGEIPDGVCTWQFNFHFTLKYVLALNAGLGGALN